MLQLALPLTENQLEHRCEIRIQSGEHPMYVAGSETDLIRPAWRGTRKHLRQTWRRLGFHPSCVLTTYERGESRERLLIWCEFSVGFPFKNQVKITPFRDVQDTFGEHGNNQRTKNRPPGPAGKQNHPKLFGETFLCSFLGSAALAVFTVVENSS